MLNLGKIFQAMADPTRRKILEMLRAGDKSAGEIAEGFNVSKPAISYHLGVLKEAGLASERRQGQQIIYSLQESNIAATWDGFMAKLCKKRQSKKKGSGT